MPESRNKLRRREIESLLESRDIKALSDICLSLDAKEISHLIDHMNRDDRLELITILPPDVAAVVIDEIPFFQATELFSEMTARNAAAIIHELHSDDQADYIGELEDQEAEAILSEMPADEAADVRKLIEYDPDSAGGLMTTEIITLDENSTVAEAVTHLRKNREAYSYYQVRYLFVHDSKSHYRGIVKMQDLLLESPSRKLRSMLKEEPAIELDVELDELMSIFEKSEYFGIAVVDEKRKIAGAVIRTSVLEAGAEKLAIEHLESQGIVGGDELRSMPVWLRSRRRLAWLSVNILLNIVAASVIAFHQDILSSVIALAVFLPIISDMSGCSGNQAVAVSMRELSLGTVRPGEVFRVLRQELSVGVINGLALGLLIAIAAWFWKGNIYLGLVAGAALCINTLVAVSIGGTVPLILKGFDIDPALASGPILTTITDMIGFLLALTFASMMLSQLGGL